MCVCVLEFVIQVSQVIPHLKFNIAIQNDAIREYVHAFMHFPKLNFGRCKSG